VSGLLVGIPVYTDPDGLLGSLDALGPAIAPSDSVVVLPDGPDPPMAEALAHHPRLAALAQWGSDTPRGNAAAFNRLAAGAPPGTRAIVLLESGARPAPDALRRLSLALEERTVGLAGPSTNDAWNAQRAVPDGSGDRDGLVAGAAALRSQFGDAVMSLAPLYSVAEFCLAASVEVLATVGAADEGFLLGPCWEMEYAARAARSGFGVVWVPAAYVHRAPTTWRRRIEETRLFDASRRRYQDRLCGLRLDGSRPGYAPHCEGDACPHFAPLERIAVRLPLPVHAADARPPTVLRGARAERLAPTPATLERARSPITFAADTDRVSCVMPTANRPEWVAASVSYFLRQNHDPKELVIVDDGEVDLSRQLGSLLDQPGIFHIRLDERRSIGAKRNLGCQRAQGAVLVQWDDDDWYGADRLRAQAQPILCDDADITALRDATWFDVPSWRFRRPTETLHRRLFVEDVHGGTLAFRRAVWELGARYPDLSLAEDAWFLRQATQRGARLRSVSGEGRYLYVRHGTNSWRLPAVFDGPDGWCDVPEPPDLFSDRAFYEARSASAPKLAGAGAPPVTALASCIMPTADRADYVSAAVASFLSQTHPSIELVVVDDGDEPVGGLLPHDARVRYVRLDKRQPLGSKRNVAVDAAFGDVIVHFDDDDWSHPERVRIQVNALATGSAEACGLDRMLWWDPSIPAAWRYTCPPLRRPWVAGNTLAYLRSTWEKTPFPDSPIGEDTAFVWGRPDRRVWPLGDERLVVGTIHAGNTSAKQTTGAAWAPVDVDSVRAMIAAAEKRAGV
jgi:glycosyltransferase involved in cell wall biosynthesis